MNILESALPVINRSSFLFTASVQTLSSCSSNVFVHSFVRTNQSLTKPSAPLTQKIRRMIICLKGLKVTPNRISAIRVMHTKQQISTINYSNSGFKQSSITVLCCQYVAQTKTNLEMSCKPRLRNWNESTELSCPSKVWNGKSKIKAFQMKYHSSRVHNKKSKWCNVLHSDDSSYFLTEHFRIILIIHD